MKLIREHINERFQEESDPIKDMGIGGISFEDIARKTIQNNKLINGRDKWLTYLKSLIRKKITGKFYIFNDGEKQLIQHTFIIADFVSYLKGTELVFKDQEDVRYETLKNERYVIV
jgi:hypothetical protein